MLLTLTLALTLYSNSYINRTVEGWSLMIRSELLRDQPKATETAIGLLRIQLQEIEKEVPSKARIELKKVQLWFSPEYPGISPRAEYHPSGVWLRENGRDPIMSKGIEFSNIRIFEAETRRMPNFALHELAHAYHDRFLSDGFQNKKIEAAYLRAKSSDSYSIVQRRDSEGKITMERAYALTNPMEYFAECSEAFFSRNDFFPFNRTDLERHDPEMAKLLTRLWGTKQNSE